MLKNRLDNLDISAGGLGQLPLGLGINAENLSPLLKDLEAHKGFLSWLENQNALIGLNVYPTVQLLFSCGALFFGVFIQLLWEEKQFTEPI